LEIWGRAPAYLFRLQKRAIRLLAGVPPRESCRSLFTEHKILPLPALHIFKCLIFLKKYPQYFEHSKFNHQYNTRNKDLFSLGKHKTVAYEKGLLYSAESFYNILPEEIRYVKKVYCFLNVGY
jgi:hypothetical protein